MKYILKVDNYYLSDVMFDKDNNLINYAIDKDYRKLYDSVDLADEDRKAIYIETGLKLKIEEFKKEIKNEKNYEF